jgi:hypothetical protein
VVCSDAETAQSNVIKCFVIFKSAAVTLLLNFVEQSKKVLMNGQHLFIFEESAQILF